MAITPLRSARGAAEEESKPFCVWMGLQRATHGTQACVGARRLMCMAGRVEERRLILHLISGYTSSCIGLLSWTIDNGCIVAARIIL